MDAHVTAGGYIRVSEVFAAVLFLVSFLSFSLQFSAYSKCFSVSHLCVSTKNFGPLLSFDLYHHSIKDELLREQRGQQWRMLGENLLTEGTGMPSKDRSHQNVLS